LALDSASFKLPTLAGSYIDAKQKCFKIRRVEDREEIFKNV